MVVRVRNWCIDWNFISRKHYMNLRKEILKAIQKSNLIYYMNRTPKADKQVADMYEKLIKKILKEKKNEL